MEQRKEQLILSNYIPQIDGIRFIAISFVLCAHWLYYPWLKSINSYLAESGVNLFFVLSGFLISRILLVQKVEFKVKGAGLFTSFYVRRMLRIFPLYFLILLLGLLFSVPGAWQAGDRIATFTINIPDDNLKLPPVFYYLHFWSLSVEEQFYLAFPLLMVVVPIKKLRLLFLVMLFIGIISRAAIYLTDYPMLDKELFSYYFTTCCLDNFAAGALLAWYYCLRPDILKKVVINKLILFLVFGTFIFVSYLLMREHTDPMANIFFRLIFSMATLCFIAATVLKVLPKALDTFLSNKIVVYLGKISYGIYVFHFFMPWIFRKLGWYTHYFRLAIPLYAILFTLATVAISALSWHFFEKPINSLKRRFSYKGESVKSQNSGTT